MRRERYEFRVDFGRDHDRQQRIFERVVFENVGEARADHRTKTELGESPWSMFARTAATEVIARQQDLRAFAARSVQNKIRFLTAIGLVAPVVKEISVE